MKNFLLNYFKLFIYYFLAFLGVFSLIWIIYIRFLRGRIFRDIPFHLSEFWFYLLLFIIFLYFYGMKNIIKPKALSKEFANIIKPLALPYLILDQLIKVNRYTVKYNKKVLKYIIPEKGRTQTLFYVLFHLVPRIIILIVFLRDVFWFHHLEKFYYYILLGIFPMLYNYYKFSLYHAKEIAIMNLEHLYYDVNIFEEGWADPRNYWEYDELGYITNTRLKNTWKPHPRNKHHDTVVTIKEYINIVFEKELDEIENDYELVTEDGEFGKDYYEFDSSPGSKEFYLEMYSTLAKKTTLEENDYKILHQDFHDIMPPLINLMIHIHYLPNMESKYHITKINFIIYFFYFIGWSYIFYKSFHSLTDLPMTVNFFEFLINYAKEYNPFLD